MGSVIKIFITKHPSPTWLKKKQPYHELVYRTISANSFIIPISKFFVKGEFFSVFC